MQLPGQKTIQQKSQWVPAVLLNQIGLGRVQSVQEGEGNFGGKGRAERSLFLHQQAIPSAQLLVEWQSFKI